MAKRKAAVIDLTGGDDNNNESSRPKPKSRTGTRKGRSFELSLVSYNVWFDPLHSAARMSALVEAILDTPDSLPRFIGLQEVTHDMATTLLAPLENMGYRVLQQPFMAYGCAMALQVDDVLDSGFEPFAVSQQDRGILWALTRVEGTTVLFTTTHLESFCRLPTGQVYNGAQERESQGQEMQRFCRTRNADVSIISGDLNWDDWRPRSQGDNRDLLQVLDSDTWTDAWKQQHPNDPGYTYDCSRNEMLRGGLRRRFDRLVYSGGARVTSTQLIGQDYIPNLFKQHVVQRTQETLQLRVTPSDHYGLRVTLQVQT